jgi:hypothetical protein
MNPDRKIPKKPDGSTDYQEIVRRFEAEQQAEGSVATGKGVNGETADLAEAPVARSNEVNEVSPAGQEALELLDRMLAQGAAFEVIREGDEDYAIWFGSAATVTDEVRAEVARLKPEIITLFLSGHPQSRRTWGRP